MLLHAFAVDAHDQQRGPAGPGHLQAVGGIDHRGGRRVGGHRVPPADDVRMPGQRDVHEIPTARLGRGDPNTDAVVDVAERHPTDHSGPKAGTERGIVLLGNQLVVAKKPAAGEARLFDILGVDDLVKGQWVHCSSIRSGRGANRLQGSRACYAECPAWSPGSRRYRRLPGRPAVRARCRCRSECR